MQCRPPTAWPDTSVYFIHGRSPHSFLVISPLADAKNYDQPNIGAKTVQPPYGTRGTGPPTFEDDGTKAFWSLPNFVTRWVVINLNCTANSPNSWITYGVICFERSKPKRFFYFLVASSADFLRVVPGLFSWTPQGTLSQINHAIGQHTLCATFPREWSLVSGGSTLL